MAACRHDALQPREAVQLLGTRHCIVQWIPVFRNAISVLPSNGLSAEFKSLVPKPAAPTGSDRGTFVFVPNDGQAIV